MEESQESILLNLKNKKMFPEFTHSSNRSKYTFNSQKLNILIQLCILPLALFLKKFYFLGKELFCSNVQIKPRPRIRICSTLTTITFLMAYGYR